MSVDMSSRKESFSFRKEVLPVIGGEEEAGMEFIFYRVTFLYEYWEKGDYLLNWNQNKSNVNKKMEFCVLDKEQSNFSKDFGVCSGNNPWVPHLDESWRWRSMQLNSVYESGWGGRFNLHSLGQILVLPVSAELTQQVT